MSYCACKHCGGVLDCRTVKGVHVEGPCPNGCDGKPTQRDPVAELFVTSLVGNTRPNTLLSAMSPANVAIRGTH